MDSGLAHHESEPCNAEDPLRRGERCTLNMSRFIHHPVDVMWNYHKAIVSVRNRCLRLATGRTRDDIKRRIWQRRRGERSERGEERGGEEKPGREK
ncbi:hypothetical protein TNCV_498321 [Trichonephila clavipes]|nr:hypothetical protein TNCV_498321 [Trichonephila clavipes]